ncbi:trichohyalin-like [Dicentrarchus labrax]|uniref:trichohyalin-like n=1 Tax=Dicentrarchus labrax TaxID=13489 RepID=UPI0021F576B1|nr:trichohyalin-like [Dicentrarchus labrax]XP_051257561.1 trichohyalin-like [Dicentrarchus labrax]
MENMKQLEDEETKNMTTIKETIKRQRQLTCQVMEEIEQLLEETQRQRDENYHLKTKTEQQQEDIDTQGSQKHEQHLLTEGLSLQIENIVEKLKENKNAATQEKIQLQKMWAEIYQERETLERRRKEIISERHKLEMIKYDKTTSQESKEPEEAMEREIIERLVADMNKNKKILLEAKQEKEHVEKNMADIKQELKRNRKDISHYRDQIEHIKQNVTVNINKMKQRWTKIQMDVQMQKATVLEMESKEREKEGRDTFDTVRMKFSRIREEIQKLWDVLEDSEPQLEQLKTEKSDSEKQRPDTDVSMKLTKWETEMQWQKQDIENKLAQVQSERDDIERTKTKMQMERENIERDRQSAKAEMDAMKCMRESIERQKQELDDRLQRTKREMRELKVMNTEIEIKKNDLVKMIGMSRRKKEEISKMKGETAEEDTEERQDMTKGQRSKQKQEAEDRSNEQKRCDSTKEITQPEEHQFEEGQHGD